MNAPLSTRQQGLLQQAAKERAAWTQITVPLRQPLRWLDQVSPWLAFGMKLASVLARAKRRPKI
jgi:hypothetical protein